MASRIRFDGLRKIYRFLRRIPLYKPKIQEKTEYTILGNPDCSFAVVLSKIRSERPVIYSFGVGKGNSFDIQLLDQVGGCAYAFDPTPKSINWVKNNSKQDVRYLFYPYGLSYKDKKENFYLSENRNFVSGSTVRRKGLTGKPIQVEMKRLKTIMYELGHTHLDLLKMDIEGSEFEVIPDILASGCKFDQLCIEIHNRFFRDGNSLSKKLIQSLNEYGYKVAYVSENYEELTFVRLD